MPDWRQMAVGYLRRGLTAAMLAVAGLAAGITTLVLLILALYQWLGQTLAPWMASLVAGSAALLTCFAFFAGAALTIMPRRTPPRNSQLAQKSAIGETADVMVSLQDVTRRSPKLSLLVAVLVGVAVGRDPVLLRVVTDIARSKRDQPM